MKRVNRLRPLVSLTAQTERDRAARLGDAQRRLAEGEQRLRDLLQYRLEYENAFRNRAQAGAEMRGLREQQQFIARLSEAVRAQEGLVEQLRGRRAAEHLHWGEAATRKQVVGKVVARAQADACARDDRAQQREHDERAAQLRARP